MTQKMGSTERLPSFKGPRDLSLSNRGKQDGTAAARPKRVFTPNIPPKRDKANPPQTTPTPSTSSSNKDSSSSPRGQRGKFQRGRGSRGRDGPGNRGGRQKPELQQSVSIFSSGAGDPLEARRSYSNQYRTGYEGSRYKSLTSEGRVRVSNLDRNTLRALIKTEDGEPDKKVFDDENYETDIETNLEDPNAPIVLPLLSYVPELSSPPKALEVETKPKPEDPMPETSSSSISSGTVSMVRIKQEKLDENEISSMPPTKTRLEDEFETMNLSQRNTLFKLPVEPTSFAGTFRSASKTGTLAYFQLPDKLPVLKGNSKEASEAKTGSGTKKALTDLVDDIDDLPEGFIGRFQILASGKTRFVLGENIFEVEPGRPVGFLQELFSLDSESNTLTNLGPINRKFVITPDIECLINSS